LFFFFCDSPLMNVFSVWLLRRECPLDLAQKNNLLQDQWFDHTGRFRYFSRP